MSILEDFLNNLLKFLIGTQKYHGNIIRVHTRKLDQLGDISFPLNVKNWYNLLDKSTDTEVTKIAKYSTIFDYLLTDLHNNLDEQLNFLKLSSEKWIIHIESYKKVDNDIHLFLRRFPLFKNVLTNTDLLVTKIDLFKDTNIIVKSSEPNFDENTCNLTSLRLHILSETTQNLINFSTTKSSNQTKIIKIGTNNSDDIICGPILSDGGSKDIKTTATDLINKRTSDVRMMAQHKYGVQVKPDNKSWTTYFQKLGRASVTIEMLSNKPHKPCKITLNNLEVCNKGPSFIFYNCARLSALFREFDKRVSSGVYPQLVDLREVNFELLRQPEEWELLFVYIVQFQLVIKNCIKDIDKNILNPQYLITFLSNLSSIFSVYYRRIRILTDPREHLTGVMQARIYLLKNLQEIFHRSLMLLNIEPIKEM